MRTLRFLPYLNVFKFTKKNYNNKIEMSAVQESGQILFYEVKCYLYICIYLD